MYNLLLWFKTFFFLYIRKWESKTLQKWGKICNVADLPPGKICNERGKICNVCKPSHLGEDLQCCKPSPLGEGLQCCRSSGGKVCKGEGLQYNTGTLYTALADRQSLNCLYQNIWGLEVGSFMNVFSSEIKICGGVIHRKTNKALELNYIQW